MVIDNYVYYRQGKIKGSDCKSEPTQGSEGVTKEEWKFPKLSTVSPESLDVMRCHTFLTKRCRIHFY